MRKPELTVRVLLALVVALLAANLLQAATRPAGAADKREAGPVGTYQISAYIMPPTDTRPNYVRGYYVVDTRTGKVEREEENVW